MSRKAASPAAAAPPGAAPAPEFEEGKITVVVRCRPFNDRERTLRSVPCIEFSPDGTSLRIFERGAPSSTPDADKGKSHSFTFDHAYHQEVTQESVYNDVGTPVLAASLRGYNTCIFAYGQTGSGKSFAMMGPGGGRDANKLPGIIPRLCNALFEQLAELDAQNKEAIRIAAEEEGRGVHELPPVLHTTVDVSYLEIYQEKVKCLLDPKKGDLKVRQHPALGVYVDNLTEVTVHQASSVMDLIEGGNNARHVASTNMNDRSSRSHAIFTVIVTQKRTSTTKDGQENSTILKSRVNLVDLAGSERAKSTGAEGDTLREGANINRSLTVLGLVISGLAEVSKGTTGPGGKQPFIPYRDSVLTFLLKESLGGNSKTFMVSTLSPAHVNYEETLSTLRYADRAKAIVTKACVNESAGDKKIRELEDEVAQLREKIREFQTRAEKQAEIAKVIPPLALSKMSKTASRGRTSLGLTAATRGRGTGATSHNLLVTPRSAINRVLTVEDDDEDPDASYADDAIGEVGDESWVPAATPRVATDVAKLEARLQTAQAIREKLIETEEHKEHEAKVILDAMEKQKTVKVHRGVPHLLNLDGDCVTDFVVEYLVDEVTYLGTSELEGAKLSNCRSIVLTGDFTGGIGPQHCAFVREGNEKVGPVRVMLRPQPGCATFLGESDEPIAGEVELTNGIIVCIGDNLLQFKFVDPAAMQPMTARRRTLASVGASRSQRTPSLSPPPPMQRGDTQIGGGSATPPTEEEEDQQEEKPKPAPTRPMLPGLNLKQFQPAVPRTSAPLPEVDNDTGDDDGSSRCSSIPQESASRNVSPSPCQPEEVAPPPPPQNRPMIPSLALGKKPPVKTTSPPAEEDDEVPNKHVDPNTVRSNVVPPLRLSQPQQEVTQPPPQPLTHRNSTNNIATSRSLTARGTSSSTARQQTVTNPASNVTASVVSFHEEVHACFRHNFVLLGKVSSGKSAFRMNLSLKDKWYSGFFKPEIVPTVPTFGVEVSKVDVTTLQRAELTFTELSGNESFAPLAALLPHRRVTYLICFPLGGDDEQESFSLSAIRSYLQFILCQSSAAETTVMLVATHRDRVPGEDRRSIALLNETEQQINTFFELLQPIQSRRPRVVAKFAIDNIQRSVLSSSSKITKFPELLTFFAEHAIQRCRADPDFPSALVPNRVLQFAQKLIETRVQGRWCISSADYKNLAKQCDPRWDRSLDDLHRHTQLLHSWGVLHHHYRHILLKRTVVLDMPWVFHLISALLCCVPAKTTYSDVVLRQSVAAATAAGTARTMQLGRPYRVTQSAFNRTPLVLSTASDSFIGRLPFSLPALERVDSTGLCGSGVLTIPAISELLRVSLLERNYTPQKGLEAILELLENYDLVIKGSKLKFSTTASPSADPTKGSGSLPTPKQDSDRLRHNSHRDEMANNSPSFANNNNNAQNAAGSSSSTAFYLMPNCFTGVAPAVLNIHLPQLLMGPSYRFSLNMIPTSFFARFVARVSKYASKMYLGPVISSNTISMSSSNALLEGGDNNGNASAPPVENANKFWSDAVWILSGPMSRAYVRMVQHSLFVTFHDRAQDEEFHDGLRQVIASLVAESPGAQCEEAILCRPTPPTGYDDDIIDFADLVWRPTEENINSLEKIRERETSALKSARGGRNDIVAKLRRAAENGGTVDVEEEEEGPIPYVRPLRGTSIDDAKILKMVTEEESLLDEVVLRVEKALKLIQRGQVIANENSAPSARDSDEESSEATGTSQQGNSAEAERGFMLEGRGMDALVDALAQD